MSAQIVPDGHKTIRLVAGLAAGSFVAWLLVDLYRDDLEMQAKVEALECPVLLRACQASTATTAARCEEEKQAIRERVRSDSNTACLALGCTPPQRWK